MAIKKHKRATLSSRFATYTDTSQLTKIRPIKKLTHFLKSKAGRNSAGRVTVRHQGSGHKRLLREVDFSRRNKFNIPAKVVALEYDPNRNTYLARLNYQDGSKSYILASEGLKIGDEVVAGGKSDLNLGNALPLREIPVGMVIHNLEIKPGKGGQIARGAGSGVTILSKEGKWAIVQLASREKRRFLLDCLATIGQASNPDAKLVTMGKAGRRRHLGWRPEVRGVAMNPRSHPHGGGEGRSGIGMPSPKSPWGKKTLGKKTRKKRKYSDRLIVQKKR